MEQHPASVRVLLAILSAFALAGCFEEPYTGSGLTVSLKNGTGEELHYYLDPMPDRLVDTLPPRTTDGHARISVPCFDNAAPEYHNQPQWVGARLYRTRDDSLYAQNRWEDVECPALYELSARPGSMLEFKLVKDGQYDA